MTAWAVFLDQPLSFAEATALQEKLVQERHGNRIPDTVLFLEHRPVVTLGTRGRKNNVLTSPEKLRLLGIDFATASRGGDVTYHGPGQLVIYPILRLGEKEADAHGYLENLEELAIRTASDFGVRSFRREGMNGAWIDDGKIAAIGFRIKKWITMHGMSFNVSVDLKGFRHIVACGLEGEKVSSLQAILREKCPTVPDVRNSMCRHFETIFQRPLGLASFAIETKGATYRASGFIGSKVFKTSITTDSYWSYTSLGAAHMI